MEKFAHGGDIYTEKRNWLDFSANINPLGLSDKAKKAILNNIDNIVNYPDPRATKLRFAISQNYNIKKENIILGNGAAELIYLFFSHMRFKKVLIVAPAFSDYERAAVAAGMKTEFLFMRPDNNFKFPWDEVWKKAKNYDCIAFGNPNNPTGTLVELECIQNFANKKDSPFIFIDESFMDFRCDRAVYETLALASKSKNLFTIRSLTKFYAIPGLRLGFGVGHKNLVEKLNTAKDIWNVNLLASEAGASALQDEAYKQNTIDLVENEKKYFYYELQNLKIKFFPPTVNFVLCVFKNINTAKIILNRLREREILVRNCENYPSLDGKYIRIAIKSHADNEKLFAALKEIYANNEIKCYIEKE